MSDETTTEANSPSEPKAFSSPPPTPADPAPADRAPAPPGRAGTDSPDDTAAGQPGGAATGERPPGSGNRRRRRGSRGGRNRKKPATAAEHGPGSTPAGGSPGGSADDSRGERDLDGDRGGGGSRGSDQPAKSDRGLTGEDLAEVAAEDAGLRAPRIGDTRPAPPVDAAPRVGDSRPAQGERDSGRPKAGDAGGSGDGQPRKRRRRGGRGRGRGGASRPAPTPGGDADVVTSSITADDADIVELDEATLERRRGRTRKGRPTGRYQMVVHVDPSGTIQMAVLEGRVLVEHYVSRPQDDETSIDGNIYLGKVQNVLPGMEAAFVDISTPKNGVLYRGDVSFDESEVDEAQPKIERLLKNGQSVTVQVTKNPIGAKGARLTQEVSLAGRFVVMVPGQPDTYGISKRLPDDERRRLRKVLEGIRPSNAGLIVRTAAEGATPDELARDLARLQEQWDQISALAKRSKPAKLLYKEPPLVVRVIREEFTKEYRSVVIDDPALYEDVKSYVEAIAPELAERVELYDEPDLPVFERFHVHEQLHKALDRKVWLPSGGSLIIERTEALTVIDVNTGKNVGKSNLEETVYQNNLEAADEIARQLRLRDIGGIIVIDFIDMEIRKNRDEVVRSFREALARDKTRTQVFDISELGLVEMTRKRISEGLVEAFSETCPVCAGRGFVVDEAML